MKKLSGILLLLIFLSVSFAQKDSLREIWQNQNAQDTSRLKALDNYIKIHYLFYQPDSAKILAELLLDLATESEEPKWVASAYNIQGISFAIRGEYDSASFYYRKGLEIQLETGNLDGIASAYNNLGLLHRDLGENDTALYYFTKSLEIYQFLEVTRVPAMTLMNMSSIYTVKGDHEKAIQLLLQSLKIVEQLGIDRDIAHVNNNIGEIYGIQEDYEKAIYYFEKSMAILESTNDLQGLAITLTNIGVIYRGTGEFEKAFEYYDRSRKIQEKIGDRRYLAKTLIDLSQLYVDMELPDSALKYVFKGLELSEAVGDPSGMSQAYARIGEIYYSLKNHSKSIEFSLKGLELAKDLSLTNTIKNTSLNLYKTYKEIGNHKNALDMYVLHISTVDSLKREENQKALIRQEYQYHYEKQHLSDSLDFIKQKELDDLAHNSELEQEAQQRYGLYGGIGFLLILGGLAFNGYRRKKKDNDIITNQKREVEAQKEIIEVAHKEITDSIAYARRIQSAILPPDRMVKEQLKEAFVLYKPKDVVAGDFYWIEPLISDEAVLFAAADCTGHGVPGAMVSVVCNNALNRAVREFGLKDPGKILDKTREIVIQEFEQSEEEVKDGMDIALCNLDLQGLEDLGGLRIAKLKYAGAHNPLWIIRKGSKEIEEIKADKQPIGKFDHPKPYQTHEVELQEGDTIYIFTDGYADQFGGEKGKKFKAANLKKLLLSVQPESLSKQKDLLNEAIENWKGNMEQVDDVCVIGVRI